MDELKYIIISDICIRNFNFKFYFASIDINQITQYFSINSQV